MAPALRFALALITERFLTILGIVADSIMFGWVMYWPSWERVVGATLFAIAIHFLVHRGVRNANGNES
jgi:membrane protein implicated in regulation of membrane protease activity